MSCCASIFGATYAPMILQVPINDLLILQDTLLIYKQKQNKANVQASWYFIRYQHLSLDDIDNPFYSV